MVRLPRNSGFAERLVLVAAPAVVVFAMAYDNGAYSLHSRNFWAIALWWGVILLVGLRASQVRTIEWPTLAIGTLLSAFALVTLLSASWGSAERAVNEFNRVSLYVGIFALTLLSPVRLSRARWCDGLGIGICAVTAVSLFSRFSPETFSDRGIAEALPGITRLSFPVGYWNGVAILVGLAVPLLLRAASAPAPTVLRAAAVAPLPAIAAVMYLASSRGGYVTGAVGAAAFVVLSRERWWPAAALAVGGTAAALAVVGLARQSAFVNRPQSELGRDQSNRALLYLVLACVAAGAGYALLVAALGGRRAPSRRVGVATAGVVVAALVAAIVAIEPLARFDDFKQPPSRAANPSGDFVQSHLLSAQGSGRWQFWETAFDAFREKPLLGQGAGSYEAWWAEHGNLPTYIRDAHSLYLEVLAELGVVGFLLLAAAFAVGFVTAVVRLRHASGGEARDLAAPTAAFVAFGAAVAIDWMWELTVVSAVAFACLGLMVRPLPGPARGAHRSPVRPALVVAGLLAAWFLVCLQALPYLSELRVRASQEAVARGDGAAALDAAEAARAIQPWAASPWLQVALVREELGDLRAAESAIVRARDRDSSNWRLWLVSARLETKLGDVAAARASLRRARSLNPRSPLFRTGGG